MDLDAFAQERLRVLRQQGTHRRLRTFEGLQGPRMRVDDREALIFAGSNYLDLAGHPEVVEAAARAARDFGCAAAGSRLINGNLSLHEELEAELADFLGTESALVFNTGYMANTGIIPVLVGSEDIVISDALNHASLIDGCRLARVRPRVFPHADMNALETALREIRAAGGAQQRVLIASDGLYSMDGDVAPLPTLLELAQRYGAWLLLDDAHATGTLGFSGRGTAEYWKLSRTPDVLVGTLGKALGSFGAFVCGSHALRELLVNTARSFIFSCALAPPAVAAARAALNVLRREAWRCQQLQANGLRLRKALADRGISTEPSTTHVAPVRVADNARVMKVTEHLLARGFYAQGIRYPSVPRGTERLRLTLMATHAEAEIDALAAAVAEELVQCGP